MSVQPTVLVAAWEGGLVALRAGGVVREIADRSVVALAPEGAAGALAVCRRELGAGL